MTAQTQTLKNLQERIAQEAERHVGRQYYDVCGNFIREVLAEQGIHVNGRLRDFGIEIEPEEREPGDVIMLYGGPDQYERNEPFHAGILTHCDHYVGKGLEEIFDLESYRERESIPLCGDFVRKVLADEGVQVPGRLRDLGEIVEYEKRQPGDLLLVWDYVEGREINKPVQVAILVEPDVLVGLWQFQVHEQPYEIGTRLSTGQRLEPLIVKRINQQI